MATAEIPSQKVAQSASEGMKVVIAIDDSDFAEGAFDFYAEHLHKEENIVTLVNVCVPNPVARGQYGGHRNTPDTLAMLQEQGKRRQKELEKKYTAILKARNLTWSMKFFTDDCPAEMICAFAGEVGASLVVTGSRGQGRVRRTLLGSVSAALLHNAPCPVVVCTRRLPTGRTGILDSCVLL